MRSYLDFEKPVAELEAKVEELRAMGESDTAVAVGDEIGRLEAKAAVALKELYAELTPWQKTQVARHPQRPHCLDYITRLIADFVPLAGDRKYGEDAAIVGGFGRFRGESVCIIGHEKGSDTDSRLRHNFGMARPEGYRKAARLMDMADHFEIPVIALIDTAGAYPGIGAEERGQAEAIARSTQAGLKLGGLGDVRNTGPFETRLSFDDLKIDRRRQFNANGLAFVKFHLHDAHVVGLIQVVVDGGQGARKRDHAADAKGNRIGSRHAAAVAAVDGVDRPGRFDRTEGHDLERKVRRCICVAMPDIGIEPIICSPQRGHVIEDKSFPGEPPCLH
jgi:hypothetical protein